MIKPDLTGKVAVVTGGAGVLCKAFAETIAECGAKVAILDLAEDKAQEVADEINKKGGTAIGVACNVLEKEAIEAAHQKVLDAFGKCDILINGAGGNNPRATTDDEFFSKETLETDGKKSFFDLDPAGFNFVFGLNFTGT